MTLSCIRWWGFSSGFVGSADGVLLYWYYSHVYSEGGTRVSSWGQIDPFENWCHEIEIRETIWVQRDNFSSCEFFSISVSVVYSYRCRCKQKHNDDFNKRTNTLLYKNIPLTLYSRKGCERVAKGLMLVMRERWVGDGDRLQHIDPKFFSRP